MAEEADRKVNVDALIRELTRSDRSGLEAILEERLGKENYKQLIRAITQGDIDDVLNRRLEDAIGDTWHWRRILKVLPVVLGEALKQATGDDKNKFAQGKARIAEVLRSGVDRETQRRELKDFFDPW